MTVKLATLNLGSWFRCPWRGPESDPCQLVDLTPSAAWVAVEELREFEVRNKHTGEIKVIKQKFKKNEPWSRGTEVEPL